jgi:hypothetical protein
MSGSGPVRHPSALALHELHLGAGDGEVAAHLGVCPECRQRLDELAADHRRFDEQVLPRTVLALRPRRRRWLWALAPAVAVAAALWLWARPRGGEERAKGEAVLTVYAARGETVTRLEEGGALAPGDRIRFVLRPGGLAYAMIASLDGAGRATVYHPYGGAQSAPVGAEPRVELPGSIVLDRGPGPERIFALLSRRPLATAEVVRALEEIGRGGPGAVRATPQLPLPVEAQGSVLFEKPAF